MATTKKVLITVAVAVVLAALSFVAYYLYTLFDSLTRMM